MCCSDFLVLALSHRYIMLRSRNVYDPGSCPRLHASIYSQLLARASRPSWRLLFSGTVLSSQLIFFR